MLAADDVAAGERAGCSRLKIGLGKVCPVGWLSLDGESGAVTLGRRAIVSEPPPELADVERWRARQPALSSA